MNVKVLPRDEKEEKKLKARGEVTACMRGKDGEEETRKREESKGD